MLAMLVRNSEQVRGLLAVQHSSLHAAHASTCMRWRMQLAAADEAGQAAAPCPAQVMQQLGCPEVECVAFATPPVVTKVRSWTAEPGALVSPLAGRPLRMQLCTSFSSVNQD
jgi:hypothetical protein